MVSLLNQSVAQIATAQVAPPESSTVLLVLLLIAPLLAAGLLALLPRNAVGDAKGLAVVLSLIPAGLATTVFILFDPAAPWIAEFYWLSAPPIDGVQAWEILNSTFYLRLDGLSVLLVLLTGIITPFILLGAWKAMGDRAKEFAVLVMLIQTGMMGAFLAYDLVLFYLFFEIMLIPTLILIAMWGQEGRFRAVLKFFVYTMFGSLLMLVAVIYVYVVVGDASLDAIYASAEALQPAAPWLFAAFALAFAIKVPLVPFHAWLPDTYRNAPFAGNALLAGILAKAGTYGFLRFAIPMFPSAASDFAVIMIVLGVIGILYGAAMAYAQTDLKQTIAYSSLSHLGMVMVGVFAWVAAWSAGTLEDSLAFSGAVYQMFNHGIITAGLFLLLGTLYERSKSTAMNEFSGLAKRMPTFAVFFMIIMLASVGLPGTNGFVGELFIIMGTFQVSLALTILTVLAVIVGAVYMFRLYQRVFFGPVWTPQGDRFRDVNAREVLVYAPIILICILGGLAPDIFLSRIGDLQALFSIDLGAFEPSSVVSAE